MESILAILLKNGVINSLSFNYEDYEYRNEDPKKLLPSIEEYAKQFKPNWIHINEKMPNEGVRVLMTNGDLICTGTVEDYNEGNFTAFYDNESAANDFTHWMPLPELP